MSERIKIGSEYVIKKTKHGVVYYGWPYFDETIDGVQIQIPSKQRSKVAASCFIHNDDLQKVVFLCVGYNSRESATISGRGVVWDYSDGHGMKLGAVVRRNSEFEIWIPGHHGHGPGERYKCKVDNEGNLSTRQQATAPPLSI